MKVPQHLIDEATRLGIVEGAVVSDGYKCTGTVPPVFEWEYEVANKDAPGCGHRISIKDDNTYLLSNMRGWATVITPAPSQGLEEGMATECSPAMRAAIIELAKELGLSDGFAASYNMDKWITWCPDCGTCPIQSGKHGKNIITPLDFLTRLEAEAKKLPKRETINGHDVTFHKGSVYLPCSQYTNETVRAIAAKLQD